MREIFLFYMQRAKFREMKCLTEAQTAGLGQRGVASRSLAPNTVLFLPYSCCLFLADIMKVLGYRPSRWSTCSYGNSRTLELEGLALPLDLTDLLSHFYLLFHFSLTFRVTYCDTKPAPDMCLALLSGQGQTIQPHVCLWRGCLCCEPKTNFAEFIVGAGSEIPSWRVFLVLPESWGVVMRPLALRLSEESPK